MDSKDPIILFKNKAGEDQDRFKNLFETHYRPLTVFAMGYVKEINKAEDIVQTVFLRLWELRETLTINKSVKAYLYQSVKNTCINFIHSKHQRVGFTNELPVQLLEDDVLQRMIAIEHLEEIYRAIEELPERCREIFKLSRIHQLKHAEIANQLNISEKTIEIHITKALKKLAKLRYFLVFFPY